MQCLAIEKEMLNLLFIYFYLVWLKRFEMAEFRDYFFVPLVYASFPFIFGDVLI